MQTQTTGLTSSLGHWASQGAALVLDADVCQLVRMGFIDTAGVILAGRHQPVVETMRRFIMRHGERPGDATLLLTQQRVASRDAALVNATSGHALDYDDVAFCGHPSVVLVPALLAEGERLGLSGLDLMRAYVVGYEVWAELFYRESDRLHDKGWHSTGVLGTIAAAAAVASLRRLDPPHCVSALSIAASMGSGVVANFGSEAKPFHAGQAAANGIDAVDLAQAGMQPAADALEHGAGLLAALSPKGRVDLGPLAAGFGRELRLRRLGLTFKRYPMCFATHRVIDAAARLRREFAIVPAEIARIHAHLGEAQIAMLRNHHPLRGVEAKFSLEFALAAALVAGRIGLAEVEDRFVTQPALAALYSRIQVHPRRSERADQPSLAASDRVVVEMQDGRTFDSGEVVYASGDAFNPIGMDELRAKFEDCAQSVGEGSAMTLFEALLDLDRCPDVRVLVAGRPEAGPRVHPRLKTA